MQPRDLFELLARLLGLWLIAIGVQGLAGVLYYAVLLHTSAGIVYNDVDVPPKWVEVPGNWPGGEAPAYAGLKPTGGTFWRAGVAQW